MTFAEREAGFSWQVLRIMAEFVDGFDFLTRLRRTVTFFGSARVSESDTYYQLARSLGKRLAEEQYTVVTGGGPGIMEAGNRGASEGGGLSVGLNIELPLEQRLNTYVKQGMGFHYFFSRKFMLDYSAMAYVYFPGGYGTLDELFTVLTLVQTGISDVAVPIILMGSEYWAPLTEWLTCRTSGPALRARSLFPSRPPTAWSSGSASRSPRAARPSRSRQATKRLAPCWTSSCSRPNSIIRRISFRWTTQWYASRMVR